MSGSILEKYPTLQARFVGIGWEVTESGCWEWKGARTSGGYGQISSDSKNSPLMAYRVSFEISNGQIPAGASICHKCDNPPCVNPEHLFAGTHTENVRDMINKKRGKRPWTTGESSPASRITWDVVEYIRSSSKTTRELERELKMSYSNIWSIRTFKSWKQKDGFMIVETRKL